MFSVQYPLLPQPTVVLCAACVSSAKTETTAQKNVRTGPILNASAASRWAVATTGGEPNRGVNRRGVGYNRSITIHATNMANSTLSYVFGLFNITYDFLLLKKPTRRMLLLHFRTLNSCACSGGPGDGQRELYHFLIISAWRNQSGNGEICVKTWSVMWKEQASPVLGTVAHVQFRRCEYKSS